MKLKRNDVSLTMAALFRSLLRTFFVFTKNLGYEIIGGGRGSDKLEAIQTNKPIINTNCERHML